MKQDNMAAGCASLLSNEQSSIILNQLGVEHFRRGSLQAADMAFSEALSVFKSEARRQDDTKTMRRDGEQSYLCQDQCASAREKVLSSSFSGEELFVDASSTNSSWSLLEPISITHYLLKPFQYAYQRIKFVGTVIVLNIAIIKHVLAERRNIECEWKKVLSLYSCTYELLNHLLPSTQEELQEQRQRTDQHQRNYAIMMHRALELQTLHNMAVVYERHYGAVQQVRVASCSKVSTNAWQLYEHLFGYIVTLNFDSNKDSLSFSVPIVPQVSLWKLSWNQSFTVWAF
jgi:hypothetical protein